MSAPPWPARSASVAFRRSALASPVRPKPSRAAAYVARAAAAARVSAMHAQALAAGSSASRYLPCRTRTFALTEKAVAVSLARSPQTLWSTSAAAFASWYASFTSSRAVGSFNRSRAWARLNKTSALAARTDAKFGDSSPLPSNASNIFSATCQLREGLVVLAARRHEMGPRDVHGPDGLRRQMLELGHHPQQVQRLLVHLLRDISNRPGRRGSGPARAWLR